MKKSSRNGKSKVPKITEAEYMAYVTALKNGAKTENGGGMVEITEKNATAENEEKKLL